MFSSKSGNVRKLRLVGGASARSVSPGGASVGVAPIQAMIRPARVRRDMHAYITEGEGKKMALHLPLRSGEMILVDEPSPEKDVAESATATDQDEVVWLRCILQGSRDISWVRAETVELEPIPKDFADLSEYLTDYWLPPEGGHWHGYAEGLSRFMGFFTLMIRPKKEKPSLTEEEEASVMKAMVWTIRHKMPATSSRLEREGSDRIYLDHESLDALPTSKEYKHNILNIHAWRPKSKDVQVPTGASQGMKELTLERRATLERPETPQEFCFYLNVVPTAFPMVLDYLAPLISPASEMATSYVSSIHITPVQKAFRRTDNFSIHVESAEGFKQISLALRSLAEEHPEYFHEEVYRLTEALAPGIGWSEGTNFSQVWEMDDAMLRSVYRFYGRVREKVDKHKGWRLFQKRDTDEVKRKWRKLEELLEAGIKKRDSISPDGEKVDKADLRKMDKLYNELVGEEGALSGHVVEWMDHYEAIRKKRNQEIKTFMSMRVSAIHEALASGPTSLDEAFLRTRAEFDKRDLDFFHPHRNKEVSPYRDEDMLLIENMGASGAEDSSLYVGFVPIKGDARVKLKSESGKKEEVSAGGEPTFNVQEAVRKKSGGGGKVQFDDGGFDFL
ncbi:hypothetical protein FUAX_50440 (plasmid) [Fulvitalea axinellae]|uniref:Uncharacterized protein n=1 Tax=Fulvitalea axinellae TaxID=1182444 RepID=A0AAU9CXS8_9BACT|nr:hypothetical protein FUAX_50440 [Fulvitalea axinellae]